MTQEQREDLVDRMCRYIVFFIHFVRRFDPNYRMDHFEYTVAPKRGKGVSLSGVRMALGDTVVMVGDLRPALREEFLEEFKKHFGKDFYTLTGDPRKVAEKVLVRGSIRSNKEFYTLKGYADTLDGEDQKATQLELWRLLERYDTEG